ncbi:glycosyltransferase family 39 protein [bacterium]|nr:glycosyltransferase family 39 protein [bacterium]
MEPQKNRYWLIVGLIIFLALLLRLPGLDYSFYGDEQFSLLRDSDYFITHTDDCHRPVFFSLLFLWRTIGFDGEVGLRLLPLLFGLATVLLAWTAGLHLGGRKFALGFSLLLAASPLHIEFSQELRPYSLIALLSMAQFVCYLRYRDRARLLDLVLGIIVGLLGMYAHMFYVFCLMGFALLAFLDRRTVRFIPFFISLIVIALFYLPNIGNVLWFYDVHNFKYVVHLPSTLPKLVASLSVGFNLFNLPELSQGRGITWRIVFQNWYYILPAFIAFGALMIGAIRWAFLAGHRFAMLVMLCLLVLPIALASILAVATYKNVLNTKYQIFLLPFILLVFAWGFQGLQRRSLQISVGVLYTFLIGMSLLHFYTDPVNYGRRSNWREASAFLIERIDSSTPVLLLEGYQYLPLHYYAYEIRPYWKYIVAPGDSIGVEDYTRYLRQRLSHAQDVFYVREDDSQNSQDPKDVALKSLRIIGKDEIHIPYNRRFQLFGWTLKKDDSPDTLNAATGKLK